jgi:hypothetical protein
MSRMQANFVFSLFTFKKTFFSMNGSRLYKVRTAALVKDYQIIRITDKAVSTSLQFPVQFVKHNVAQQWTKGASLHGWTLSIHPCDGNDTEAVLPPPFCLYAATTLVSFHLFTGLIRFECERMYSNRLSRSCSMAVRPFSVIPMKVCIPLIAPTGRTGVPCSAFFPS